MMAQLMGHGKVFAGCSKIGIDKDDFCLLYTIYTPQNSSSSSSRSSNMIPRCFIITGINSIGGRCKTFCSRIPSTKFLICRLRLQSISFPRQQSLGLVCKDAPKCPLGSYHEQLPTIQFQVLSDPDGIR